MIQLTKYSVSPEGEQTIEELMEQVTENLSVYVENNMDISATIIHKEGTGEGTGEVTVKLLKLNEHSN